MPDLDGPSYMSIRLIPSGQTVHRTAEIRDGLLVDLDDQGAVLGIENIHGQVGLDSLGAVLRWLRAPKEDDDDRR